MPWLAAWTRLIVDDAVASDVANEAVARAASRRKRLRGPDLKVAARLEAARMLASGAAAAPPEHAEPSHPTSFEAPPGTHVGAYSPSHSGPAGGASGRGPASPDPREQTAVGRLEMALETLAPYQRLACVCYFLDGASTDAVASLLGVRRERAIRILEGAAPAIVRAVGDIEIPDFSVSTDEVEVVTL